MSKHVFELYVTGNSSRSENARKALKEMCDKYIAEDCEVDIIDVLEYPDIAEQNKVLATPTLIRRVPPPVRRLVGDLSDTKKLKQYMDIL
jgi:circadian clock protein KaiB